MKGEQLGAALYEAITLCWPAPESVRFTAKRALPLHATAYINIQAVTYVNLRCLLFCKQTFLRAFRSNRFPRLDMGKNHAAETHMRALLGTVHYNAG